MAASHYNGKLSWLPYSASDWVVCRTTVVFIFLKPTYKSAFHQSPQRSNVIPPFLQQNNREWFLTKEFPQSGGTESRRKKWCVYIYNVFLRGIKAIHSVDSFIHSHTCCGCHARRHQCLAQGYSRGSNRQPSDCGTATLASAYVRSDGD